jgi:hypothetical protein
MRLASKKDRTLPERKQLEWLLAELMDGYSAVSRTSTPSYSLGVLLYITLTLLPQTVDAPSIWLVPELLELYPDAVGQ